MILIIFYEILVDSYTIPLRKYKQSQQRIIRFFYALNQRKWVKTSYFLSRSYL